MSNKVRAYLAKKKDYYGMLIAITKLCKPKFGSPEIQIRSYSFKIKE